MSKQRGEINVRQVAVIASAGMGFLSFPGVIILVVAIGVCILMASGGSAQPANASQPAGCFGSDADAGAGTGTAAAAADSLAKLTAAQVTNLRAIDVAARAAHADSTAEATLLATASAQTSLLNVANDGTSTETAVFGSGAARTLTDPERAAAKTSLQLPHDSVTHHLNRPGRLRPAAHPRMVAGHHADERRPSHQPCWTASCPPLRAGPRPPPLGPSRPR